MTGGFSSYYSNCLNTSTYVPSALCLKSQELAEYAETYLIELYKEVYE